MTTSCYSDPYHNIYYRTQNTKQCITNYTLFGQRVAQQCNPLCIRNQLNNTMMTIVDAERVGDRVSLKCWKSGELKISSRDKNRSPKSYIDHLCSSFSSPTTQLFTTTIVYNNSHLIVSFLFIFIF